MPAELGLEAVATDWAKSASSAPPPGIHDVDVDIEDAPPKNVSGSAPSYSELCIIIDGSLRAKECDSSLASVVASTRDELWKMPPSIEDRLPEKGKESVGASWRGPRDPLLISEAIATANEEYSVIAVRENHLNPSYSQVAMPL